MFGSTTQVETDLGLHPDIIPVVDVYKRDGDVEAIRGDGSDDIIFGRGRPWNTRRAYRFDHVAIITQAAGRICRQRPINPIWLLSRASGDAIRFWGRVAQD
jgi:hypothetical protein